MCPNYGSKLLVRNIVAGARALHFRIRNMTRQLYLASLMLQADCGDCTYYRLQDENSTRKCYLAATTCPLCLCRPCLVIFSPPSFSYPILFSSVFVLSYFHLQSCPPPLLLSLSITRSPSLIQLLECTLMYSYTHVHTHTRTLPHTPVSNLYEMIPNAFGSHWEFPL